MARKTVCGIATAKKWCRGRFERVSSRRKRAGSGWARLSERWRGKAHTNPWRNCVARSSGRRTPEAVAARFRTVCPQSILIRANGCGGELIRTNTWSNEVNR